jgi:hypothetical protein
MSAVDPFKSTDAARADNASIDVKIVETMPMSAAMTVAPDRVGAEHYLLVIKRTFDIPMDRSVPKPAMIQDRLIEADQYYGDPASTSIHAASDWAFRKPKTDLIVIGSACSPRGSEVRALDVRLRVGSVIDKTIRVTGDRFWQTRLIGAYHPSDPLPFERLPIVYERAFGGADTSPTNPKHHRFHRENLVGVGVFASTDPDGIVGKKLPNLAPPGRPLAQWGETTKTVCFGFVSPHWVPRADYAGTYDQAWLDSRYPLLPTDFNEFFHQTAPADQVIEGLRDAERITITNMHPDGTIEFAVPPVELPVVFMFKDQGDHHVTPKLDTVVVRPNDLRFSLVWRVSVRCAGKLYSLRQVVVGEKPARWFAMQRSVKPHYRSLADFIAARHLR